MAEVVRFSLPHGVDARGVAAEVVEALGVGGLAEPISGDRDQATILYRWLADEEPERIAFERVAPPNSVRTAYRDHDPRSVWLLRRSKERPIDDLPQRLATIGAGDVRAFTEEEWEKR